MHVKQSAAAQYLQWSEHAVVPVSSQQQNIPFEATDSSPAAAALPHLAVDAPSTSPIGQNLCFLHSMASLH